MSDPFIDTNVFVRLLAGDDLAMQAAARRLFEEIENEGTTVQAPDTVIADAVFVLASKRLYNLSRVRIRDGLAPLVALPNLQIANRDILLRALDIYADTRLGFGDAMLLAAMEAADATEIYSWDEDFDGLPGIVRREPR